MSHWIHQALLRLSNGSSPICRVTVVANQGSTPREEGASMLVGPDFVDQTIGGGRLEFEAINKARQYLAQGWPESGALMDDLVLGPALGQCCGGRTKLLFECLERQDQDKLQSVWEQAIQGQTCWISALDQPRLDRRPLDAESLSVFGPLPEPAWFGNDQLVMVDGEPYLLERIGDFRQPLYLFGAGHVGQAVAQCLTPLPFNLTWLDSREDQVASLLASDEPITSKTRPKVRHSSDPLQAIAEQPKDCWSLVMTHSHRMDEDICQRILARGDFGYLGLIGSSTKRARFVNRLTRKNIPTARLEQMHCPIGLPDIGGKQPAVIAASVAADLLRRRDQQNQEFKTKRGVLIGPSMG